MCEFIILSSIDSFRVYLMSYASQSVNVSLPQPLFQRLQRIAETTHRSVEDVLTTTINVALPPTPDLSSDLADELTAMVLFSDEDLQAACQSSLSVAQQKRLGQLSHSGGYRPLTNAESQELRLLLNLYDYAILRRAKALAVLAQRGYDIDIIGL